MKVKVTRIAFVCLAWLTAITAYAQTGEGGYEDPDRAAAIVVMTNQYKKTLQAQERVQLLNASLHLFIDQETMAITNYQREFNDYLDEFHELISMLAETYGIYMEVTKLAKNIGELNKLLATCPVENLVATGLSQKRTMIYKDLVDTGAGIVNDIRMVFFSKIKMTEKQRLQMVFRVRPKLNTFNAKLKRAVLVLKYTTFLDVWQEFFPKAYQPRSRKKIAEECRERWKNRWTGGRTSF